MRSRLLTFAGAITVAVFVASVVSGPVAGQAPRTQSSAAKYTPKRMADGHPDLQGLYDIATLTPLEATGKTILSDEEAKQAEDQQARRRERAALPSDGKRQAPPVGGDGSTGASGNVGGYNNFWIDSGERYVVIDGQRRNAIVIEPADGRVPPARRGGGFGAGRGAGAGAGRGGAGRGGAQAGAAPAIALPTSDAAENAAPTGRGAYDNVEQRPLAERCLLGFGSTSGPPALPVLYNNLKQIVQTPDYVMILNEMDHDARIVRMNQPHVPKTIRKWMGDAVGYWDRDTLVVETTNFTDKTRYRGSSPDLKITERFSRLDEKTLLYRFTIEDPATWDRPWTGEYTWPQAPPDDLLYEYACHEGNHALGDILRGARLLEKEQEGVTGGR
jgi:hypothetical protein